MPAALTDFAGQLRELGVPVGLSEVVDAAAAIQDPGLRSLDQLGHALAATLIKDHAHRALFDLAFADYLTELTAGRAAARATAPVAAGPGAAAGLARLRELIAAALAADDQAALRALADLAVARHAGLEPGRVHGTGVYLLRVLRALRLDDIAAALAAAGPDGSPAPALAQRLLAGEIRKRAGEFTRHLEAAVRQHMIADLGREAVQEATRRPLPGDVDLVFAQPADLAVLREAIPALSRKLQLRLQRGQRRSNAVDFRQTIRGSLATGGVPAEIRYHPADRPRPELLVLADVSGSVAQFAQFSLYLLHSLSRHFGHVRSFAFVDGIDEVTALFRACDHPAEAARQIISNDKLIWFDGHSDYGHAMEVFLAQWGHLVSARTTVLIIGDGRSNDRHPQAWVLREVARRADAVHWLNPEPQAAWGTGDSAMGDYGLLCTSVTECRTFTQLARFIEGIA